MNNLGEEAEAFFRHGDEGTYEGGPASIAPLVQCDDPANDWDVRSADDWLDRRRLFKRFVATVVGGLSAGLVILFACLLATRGRTVEDQKPIPRPASLPRVPQAPALPAATVVVPAATAAVPAVVPAATAAVPAVVPAATTAVPAATAVKATLDEPLSPPEASSAAVRAPSAPSPVSRGVASTRSHALGPYQRAPSDPRRATAADALPRGSADLPVLSGKLRVFGGPPTAFFPN